LNTKAFTTGVRRRIRAARRRIQPPKPAAATASTAEFLYVPCARPPGGGHLGETHRRVQAVPIVKKTTKLIYYTSDSWNWREAVVSPGCVSREQFEADTRRHGGDRCRHGYPAGVIPIPGVRNRSEPAGRLFFATRGAAEADLRRGERERAREAAREASLIKRLRRIMVDAHPDRGGTADQFIRARRRYQSALRQTTMTEGSP
jgi:hypothetical protein